MNLYFRLLIQCFSYLFDRRRLDLFGASKLDFRVLPLDIDMNGHMNNGRYLTLMDLGRFDLLVRFGLIRTIIKRRWMPVLSASVIRYRVPLNPLQTFRLKSRLVWWDDKFVYIEQRFIITDDKDPDRDGIVAAVAVVKGMLYDARAKAGVPTKDILPLIPGSEGVKAPEKPAHIDSLIAAEDDLRALTKDPKPRS